MRTRVLTRRSTSLLAVAALLATLTLTSPAGAAPAGPSDDASFATAVLDIATTIVRGHITGARSEHGVSPLASNQIITIFDVQIDETLIDASPSPVEPGVSIPVIVEGGTINGFTHRVSHQAELAVGQTVTLALVSVDGHYSVVGGHEGVHQHTPTENLQGLEHNRSLLTTDYVLHGDRWDYPGSTLEFYVNPSGSGVAQSATVLALINGSTTWQDDPQSGIEVSYLGNDFSVNIAQPTDFKNVAFWADTPNPAHTFLAKASWYEYASNPGFIVGFDVHFNNDYAWDVNPSVGEYDIESAMLHEMGHVLGLDHAPDPVNTMHDSLGDTHLRRSLGPGDRAGIAALYPVSNASCNGEVATIVGTDASETLNGTSGRDVIVGGGGDDIIWGLAGNDLICGDAGRDRIYAGTGSDTVYGGSEIDYIWGEGGTDYLYGEGGSDRLRGGDQNDFLYGDSGADRIYGGAGNDTIAGQGGQDFIWGDSGDDNIGGNWQTDTIYGGTGNDTIRGHGGKDKLFGEAGADKLYGGENTDTLDGGASNDELDGGRGTDTLTGGTGTDILNGGKHTDTCNDTVGTTFISC